jgi:DNA-directed RNA polymerase specialized sigma24 family protein
MIEHVNARLNDWARWWLRGGSRQSVVSSIYRLRPGEYNPECAPPEAIVPINDMDACKVDWAIAAVGRVNPALRIVVMAFYLRQSPAEYIAQDLGMSKATLFRRIDQAHQLILGYLHDIEAGVPLPPALPDPVAEKLPAPLDA